MRYKRPAKLSIGVDMDAQVIEQWKLSFPNSCRLVHGDAVAFLEQFPFTGQELVYSDPPYLSRTRRQAKIYRHEYTDQDHEQLLDLLTRLPCKVMISGYENPMYRERLTGWRTVTFPAKTHVDVREEYVWMNFPEPTELHDSSFLGATFRERQTVKRRQQRMLEHFKRMNPVERIHMLKMLNAQYGETRRVQ